MSEKRTPRPKRLLVVRQRSARAVLWALDTFGARLRPSERPFVGYLRRRLVARRNALARSERHLRRRETLRSRRVRRRDRVARELRALMVAGRGVSAHLFGDEKLAEIGFARRVAQDAEALLEQATSVVAAVRDPGFVPPRPRLRTLTVDLRDLTTDLEPAIGKVRGALDELQAARCDVTLALHDRNVALDAFNRDFLHVARIVEGLLRRADLDELAERVRPSTRRRGTTRLPFVEAAVSPSPAVEGLTASADVEAPPVKPSPARQVASHSEKTLSGVRPRETIAPP
jgi:hypothetical protein